MEKNSEKNRALSRGMKMKIKQATLSRLIKEEFKKILAEGPKMGMRGGRTFESYRTVLKKAKQHAEAQGDNKQAVDIQNMYDYFVEKGWI